MITSIYTYMYTEVNQAVVSTLEHKKLSTCKKKVQSDFVFFVIYW